MAKFIKKKTKLLSKNEVTSILRLKKFFWRYSLKSHKDWFGKNIKKNDIHFFYKKRDVIKMYCCLRFRHCKVGDIKMPFYYLDTLCSVKSYRYRILNFLIFIIENTHSRITITLCENVHLGLYSLMGFKKKKFSISNHDVRNLNTLINIPRTNKYKRFIEGRRIQLKI